MTNTYRQPPNPTPKPCPRCKRKTLTGLDARAAALTVTIDAETLTRNGELINIVNGIEMYATNNQGQILRRTASEILKHGDHLEIHRVHECDQETPATLIQQKCTTKIHNTDEYQF